MKNLPTQEEIEQAIEEMVKDNCPLEDNEWMKADIRRGMMWMMERMKADEAHAKALNWIGTGFVGSSSKTMWNCLIGNNDFPIDIPWDFDDFGRCYRLLEEVPEWKSQLHKLKILSPLWSDLVDNWAELTKLHEQCNRAAVQKLLSKIIKHKLS